MSKSVFIGIYEINKLGIEGVIKILKKYNFDIVYADLSVCEYYNKLAKVVKVFAWIHYGHYNIQSLTYLINNLTLYHKISGIILDYVRAKDEDYGLRGVFYNITLYNDLKELMKNVSVVGLEFHACLKQGVFDSFLGNETLLSDLDRLKIGQSIWLHGRFFSKMLLMGYHECFGVSIEKVINTTKKLQEKYGDILIPIHQTYRDNPVVNYNIIWYDVIKASKEFDENSYFRLATCNPISFS